MLHTHTSRVTYAYVTRYKYTSRYIRIKYSQLHLSRLVVPEVLVVPVEYQLQTLKDNTTAAHFIYDRESSF